MAADGAQGRGAAAGQRLLPRNLQLGDLAQRDLPALLLCGRRYRFFDVGLVPANLADGVGHVQGQRGDGGAGQGDLEAALRAGTRPAAAAGQGQAELQHHLVVARLVGLHAVAVGVHVGHGGLPGRVRLAGADLGVEKLDAAEAQEDAAARLLDLDVQVGDDANGVALDRGGHLAGEGSFAIPFHQFFQGGDLVVQPLVFVGRQDHLAREIGARVLALLDQHQHAAGRHLELVQGDLLGGGVLVAGAFGVARLGAAQLG